MTYADNFDVRTADVTFNKIASGLDGLLLKYAQYNSNTLINTPNTSLTDVTGSDCTVSLVTGERALLLAAMNVSAGTAGAVISFDVSANGSDLAFGNNVTLPSGLITGAAVVIPWVMVYEGLPGTITFRLRWCVNTGTAYSQYQRLVALAFRNY